MNEGIKITISISEQVKGRLQIEMHNTEGQLTPHEHEAAAFVLTGVKEVLSLYAECHVADGGMATQYVKDGKGQPVMAVQTTPEQQFNE